MSLLVQTVTSKFNKYDIVIDDPLLTQRLDGILYLPDFFSGLVIFAHGSASSRKSPRNDHVAQELAKSGIASLLFDLLTDEESLNRKNIFNVGFLSERLLSATRWVQTQDFAKGKFLSYFGASTGSAAALLAAAKLGTGISSVVSRSGRPDLVPNQFLGKIKTPCLFIVGELDESVVLVNRKVLEWLPGAKLIVVPGATHLFEEEGTLDQSTKEAVKWFAKGFRERELERMTNLQ